MESINQLLQSLILVDGIAAAVVIGNDGFVIDSMSTTTIDTDVIGGIVSGGIKSTDEMGSELNIGKLNQSMIEYDKGVILTKMINNQGAILAIVTKEGAVIGNVRYQLNKFSDQIAKLL